MGFDLGDSYFIHTVLIVDDLEESLGLEYPNVHKDMTTLDNKHRFQRFEVYIGDDPDWSLNAKVEGGPWLNDPDDPNDPDYTSYTIDNAGT